MNIYSTQFKPTYLYIKQHSITGKLYFGKTIKDPDTYFGSGKRWTNHIKKHGKEHVINLWYCLFYDEENIKEFALTFSNNQNIVESEIWLNLKPENGLDGGAIIGYSHSSETRLKISESNKGKLGFCSEETRLKLSLSNKGRKVHSEEFKKSMSDRMKGVSFSQSHKDNMSKVRIGVKCKPRTEESKKKTSDAIKLWHQTRKASYIQLAHSPELAATPA